MMEIQTCTNIVATMKATNLVNRLWFDEETLQCWSSGRSMQLQCEITLSDNLKYDVEFPRVGKYGVSLCY